MQIIPLNLARAPFCVVVSTLCALWLISLQPVKAADKAYSFMRTVTNKLQSAQRKPVLADRTDSFAHVIKNYAHLGEIGHRALGSYKHKLKKSQRRTYYAGMAGWIGYYAATEAVKFPVKRVLLTQNAIREGNNYIIDSKIELEDGSTYDVRWLLLPSRQSFKVVEVQIDVGLGLTDITPYLRDLFVKHIEENDKSVESLVATLGKFVR